MQMGEEKKKKKRRPQEAAAEGRAGCWLWSSRVQLLLQRLVGAAANSPAPSRAATMGARLGGLPAMWAHWGVIKKDV